MCIRKKAAASSQAQPADPWDRIKQTYSADRETHAAIPGPGTGGSGGDIIIDEGDDVYAVNPVPGNSQQAPLMVVAAWNSSKAVKSWGSRTCSLQLKKPGLCKGYKIERHGGRSHAKSVKRAQPCL